MGAFQGASPATGFLSLCLMSSGRRAAWEMERVAQPGTAVLQWPTRSGGRDKLWIQCFADAAVTSKNRL